MAEGLRAGLVEVTGASLSLPSDGAGGVTGDVPEEDPQLPEGGVPAPDLVTAEPGFGNSTSVPSTVVQPFPMLALKRSG